MSVARGNPGRRTGGPTFRRKREQEFLTICKNLSDEEVKIAFEKFDTSGDDKLDYREFCMMINNNRRDQDM